MNEQQLRPIAALILLLTWVVIAVMVFSYVFIKVVGE